MAIDLDCTAEIPMAIAIVMQIFMMKWASASTAIEIERLLNAGKRDAAKALVSKYPVAGTAEPETQQIAAMLFSARRGRQPTDLQP